QSRGGLSMTIQPAQSYSNAQIADYSYARFDFRWKPPLRLTVTAWASGGAETLRGTAGFGFWNHPFSPDARRLPRLPQAIWWFFAAPPSHMALAYDVPGHGWKAATLDAARPAAWALAPLALPAALLMRAPRIYKRLYPAIQRRLRIGERLLDDRLLAERHSYTIEWRQEHAVFAVDGAVVLETPFAPRGAAGFVAWIDNQYAVVTPQGRLGFGIVPVERAQSLVLERIIIERL
ncbi:MAG: hypothetical protein ABI835_15035, partial [Chloroflexota bacterium]